ncbi:hypothetical protein ABIA18_001070 [Sinorhizobium fredii]
MKSICTAAVLAVLMAGTASAETIGVSMQSFDNNFQTLLRQGLDARASEVSGVNLQIEDAQTDISKQRSQVDNFIASGVDAIIMTLADTSAAPGHQRGSEEGWYSARLPQSRAGKYRSAAREAGLCRLKGNRLGQARCRGRL